MRPHRDWTRHGVGRALLWWPFMAFVAVAAFPALAVPGVVATGAFLIVVGLVGGTVRRRRRARRLRDAEHTVVAPRAIVPAVVPSPREPSTSLGNARQQLPDTADAEGDKRSDLQRRAA